MLHIADGQVRTHHLRHLASEATRRIHHDLAGHFTLLGVDLPFTRWQAIDIDHAVVTNNSDSHICRTPRHGVGQARRVRVAIIERPGAGNHPINVIKRIDLLDLGGINNLHAETDVIGNTLHVVEPIQVSLLARNTDTPRGVPADVLPGLFLKFGVEPVTVVMDFGKVVITHQTGTLSSGMPGRTRGQLAFLDQHDVGLAFLGEVVSQRHTHDAAAHDHDPSLRIHRHTAPPFIVPSRLPWVFQSRQC